MEEEGYENGNHDTGYCNMFYGTEIKKSHSHNRDIQCVKLRMTKQALGGSCSLHAVGSTVAKTGERQTDPGQTTSQTATIQNLGEEVNCSCHYHSSCCDSLSRLTNLYSPQRFFIRSMGVDIWPHG